jgi:tRNA (guanosine-2'-O-)-methyltransferase
MAADGLTEYLERFVSEQRRARLQQVIAGRTAHIRVVLEDVYQAHNASAVLRSCDCFGIQHIHFIENRNTMRVNDEVAMGSSQWLTIHRHNKSAGNTEEALSSLKRSGYRIIGVTPHADGYDPMSLPLDQPVALVFGTEMKGMSEAASSMADACLAVPMHGFTESLNVSVCAALCMFELTRRMRTEVPSWRLSGSEREEIYRNWLTASIEMGDAIVADFLKNKAG